MKLYTENLILTTLKPKDADKVLSFVLRNRERLTPVEPKRQPDYYSLKGQMRLLSYDTQAMRKGTSFRLWVVPKSNPDIIIGSWCGKKFRAEQVAARAGWQDVPAVRDGQLFEIKSPEILQPGPAALTDGADALHRIVTQWMDRHA